ncbi:MAG: hypothetical protein GXO93_04035, partial [FCB group bacterium]|nr:hypothetical protein [FCB group bacterium]
MRLSHKLSFIFILLLVFSSCASHKAYINEEADFGFYHKVGVIPFSNLSNAKNASEKVTSTFVTQLLMQDVAQVANIGDFLNVTKKVFKKEKTNILDELTSEEAKKIGEEAKVQGVFIGAINEFGMVRSGQNQFPLISLSVKFIDCQSGAVVWSYETTRKGGPKFPIFSFGET